MIEVHVYVNGELSTFPFQALNGQLGAATLCISRGCEPALLAPHLSGLVIETIMFKRSQCLIAHRKLTFYQSPQPGSGDSHARYWIFEVLSDGTRLLLQELPRLSDTSTHWHPDARERFRCILGSCTLLTSSGNMLKQGTPGTPMRQRLGAHGIEVAPGVVHQLTTASEPALNLIEIRGTKAKNLKEIDHRHVSWSR
ncbi:MAG: hypothetical protein Q8R32_01075 [bacterium]|nr:hypothetical protein [bacterium]